jgi:hypothetical protein
MPRAANKGMIAMNRKRLGRTGTTLLVFFLLGSMHQAPGDRASAQTRSVGDGTRHFVEFEALWWLPPDSETLLVNSMSRSVRLPQPNRKTAPTVAEESGTTSLGILGEIQNGSLLVPLAGHEVAVEVRASRHFRAPSGLGPMIYDGVELFRFRGSLGKNGPQFTGLLNEKADRHEVLEGSQVAVFEKRYERTLWTFYVTLSQPDLLLCATDRDSLVQTLRRKSDRAAARAFPPSLPEWKYVDSAAKYWAIRHFNSNSSASPLYVGAGSRAAAPTERATGLVFSLSPQPKGFARVIYLSRGDESLATFKEFWARFSQDFASSIRRKDEASAELVLPIEEGDIQGAYDFFFALYAALGHGVCL